MMQTINQGILKDYPTQYAYPAAMAAGFVVAAILIRPTNRYSLLFTIAVGVTVGFIVMQCKEKLQRNIIQKKFSEETQTALAALNQQPKKTD